MPGKLLPMKCVWFLCVTVAFIDMLEMQCSSVGMLKKLQDVEIRELKV